VNYSAGENEKMATFLDVTVLENFSVIFVFLLVAIGGYAVLLYLKPFGSNQLVSIILSVITAFFVILNPIATLVVKTMTPIFAVIMIFVAITSIASGMFGGANLESLNNLKWIALVIIIISLIVGTLSIVRENIEVPEKGEDFSKVSTIIFHPNFLGMVLILLIAVFTVGLLAVKQM